ncbi:MAG: hypothetical protein ACLQUT_10325 [Thermoleophilia bacterium]|jgi:hypothetical protein
MAADYKIELFIFPDGVAVEMLVFAGADHSGKPRDDGKLRSGATMDDARAATPAPGDSARAADNVTSSESAKVVASADVSVAGAHVSDTDLDVCPQCGCDLVYPTDWTRLENRRWRLTLRCPNCELRRQIVVARSGIEHFNRQLFYGTQRLTAEADALSRRHFAEEGEKLVAAVRANLILPMDF